MMIPLLFALLAADRALHSAVTDASGRAVTGLNKISFTIRENGYARPSLDLANPESDITVVVLEDETAQAREEARKQLDASTAPRKVLIIATRASAPQDLGRVLVLYRSTSESAAEAAETIRNQYVLFFDSGSASGIVDISVQPPRGFPPLKVIR